MPALSRRAHLGAMAALVPAALAQSCAVPAVAAPGPDAELIRLCAEAQRLWALPRPSGFSSRTPWEPLLQAAAVLPAHTGEGMLAKAAMVRTWLEECSRIGACGEERLTLSLMADVERLAA